MTRRYTRKTLPADLADWQRWMKVDLTDFDAKMRSRADNLTDAIKKYLAFKKVSPLLEKLGLAHEQLLRALNRCVSLCEDGRPFGWRGLIPFLHVKEYERTAAITPREAITKGGYAGALGKFWNDHPDLKERFDKFLLTRRRDGLLPEARVTPRIAHDYFIDLCKEVRLTDKQWPFCVDRLGEGAVDTYVHRFFDENYDAVVVDLYGEKAKAKSKTGTGKSSRLVALWPYDIVELDEHKAHFIGAIGIPTPKGIRWRPVGRVTLLLAVDRSSEVVLAYAVIFRREARTADVMAVIARALRPWVPRLVPYPDGAGFPAGCIEGLDRCGWVMLLIDNALVHLAFDVIERARRWLGCAVNFGAVRRFERRAIAELVFHELERVGFHRVSSTTGTGPHDARRRDPEAQAVKCKMHINAVLDLVDMVLAKFNSKVGEGNFALSGLDYLRSVVSDEELGFLPPTLPPKSAHEPDLDVVIESGVIAGNRKRGERPHVVLDGEAYTNPKLANRWDLLGKPVRNHINEDNIQSFDAYLEDRTSLGTLFVMGRWSRTPHSREARRLINAAITSGELRLTKGQDPVVAWREHLALTALAKGQRGNKTKTTREATTLAEELRRTNSEVPNVDPDTRAPVREVKPTAVAVAEQRLDIPHGIGALN